MHEVEEGVGASEGALDDDLLQTAVLHAVDDGLSAAGQFPYLNW